MTRGRAERGGNQGARQEGLMAQGIMDGAGDWPRSRGQMRSYKKRGGVGKQVGTGEYTDSLKKVL